jgi:hypothetical protein
MADTSNQDGDLAPLEFKSGSELQELIQEPQFKSYLDEAVVQEEAVEAQASIQGIWTPWGWVAEKIEQFLRSIEELWNQIVQALYHTPLIIITLIISKSINFSELKKIAESLKNAFENIPTFLRLGPVQGVLNLLDDIIHQATIGNDEAKAKLKDLLSKLRKAINILLAPFGKQLPE